MDVLDHDLEVVEVWCLFDVKDCIELATTLLRKIESVDLRVDEDTRCQVVGIKEEGVMLYYFRASLERN